MGENLWEFLFSVSFKKKIFYTYLLNSFSCRIIYAETENLYLFFKEEEIMKLITDCLIHLHNLAEDKKQNTKKRFHQTEDPEEDLSKKIN